MTASQHTLPHRSLRALLLSFGLLLPLAGCGGAGDDEPDAAVRIAYVNWADGIAITNLTRAILEDEFGYDVELVMADPGPVFASVAEGDNDLFLDAWLPNTHSDYWERFGDQFEDLGAIYEGCRLGLVVNADAPVTSIAELNDHADLFDGRIQGIDSGAGLMRLTKNAIDAYGLDLELIPASGPAMTAAIQKAENAGDPVLVTGWKPHWKFNRFKVRFLEDPQGVYGIGERIHAVARADFSSDHATVATFIRDLTLTDDQLGSLMDRINRSDEDPVDVARAWIEEHRDAVDAWLPERTEAEDAA
jgi:glycine betaine/proline transport system substrate-binding protein